MKLKKKVIISASIGNILEFFDFTLFGIFAPVIAPLFFPSQDPLASYIAAFGAFAVGFLARPLGALIFGNIGDKIGRKNALSLSIILMALSTFLIGLAPTYQTIGIWSSVCIFLIRILQGVCAGGEFNGSAVYVLEQAKKEQAGFYGGILISACVSGTILATLLWIVYKQFNIVSWAWRVPFLLGSLIGIIGFYLRRSLQETEVFIRNKKLEKERLSVWEGLKETPREIFTMVGIGAFNGCVIYTLFSYSIFYLTKILSLNPQSATYSSLLGLFSLIITTPYFGRIGDMYGHEKLMKYSGVIMIPFSFIYYFILKTQQINLVIFAQILLGLLGAAYVGNQHAVSVKIFKPLTRYTGTSLGYSLGMALFGGTTPVISTYLFKLTDITEIPALWLMVCSILGFIGIKIIKKQT